MNDNLLTIKEAAIYLKVHWQTIRNYIKTGSLKTIKIGRTIRVKKEDLDRMGNPEENEVQEVELRFKLKNKLEIENKLRKMGAKLTNHSHIIDDYYCNINIKNMKEKDKWYDSPTGFGIRIRQIDNDYSGKINMTLEIKKLAGPDYTDHTNCLEAEIDVKDFKETERLILMLNQKKFLTVDKERFVYRLNDIKFCFDTFKEWGEGLEIEKVTTESPVETRKILMSYATKLGLTKEDMPLKSITHDIIQKLAKF